MFPQASKMKVDQWVNFFLLVGFCFVFLFNIKFPQILSTAGLIRVEDGNILVLRLGDDNTTGVKIKGILLAIKSGKKDFELY